MKQIFFMLCVLLVCSQSFAQDRKFGAGIILGEPTGISAKYWTSGSNSLDFGLGWFNQYVPVRGGSGGYYFSGTRFQMHTDYLWHSFDAIRSSERFPLFYGVGALLASGGGDPAVFGVRGVFGISWMPRSTPLDIFIELAPTLQLTPATGLVMGAGFGGRYFF